MTRIIYLIPFVSWVVVGAYMLPAVFSIFARKPRVGDAARLVSFGWALLMIGFIGRRLATHEAIDQSLISLLTLSTVMAAATLLTARSYGRGPLIPLHIDV